MFEIQYKLCPSCTVVLVNGDDSHLDDMADDARARLDAFVEDHGMVVHTKSVAQPGYWDCEACGEVQIGDPAELFEDA